MSDWDDDDYSHSAPTNEHRSPRSSRSYNYRRSDSTRHQRDRNAGERRGNGRPKYAFKDTIEIRSDCIGLIIGKGGSNIQRLQSEFSVLVDVDKVGGNVTVWGNRKRDIEKAFDKIKDQMMNAEGGRGGRSDRNSGNSCYDNDNDFYSRNSKDKNGFYNRSSNDNGDCYSITNNDNREGTGGLIDWAALYKKSDEVYSAKWAKCPTLTKNFYKESAEVAKLTSQQVAGMRLENNNISVSRVFVSEDGAPNDIPNPIWKFEQCFVEYPDLLQEIQQQGFKKPSPIQAQGWPVLLKGEDMIGIAQTGTGKTLAFLLPAMIHTEGQSTPRSQRGGPNILILAPTRELALQIEKEVKKYKFRGMKAVCVYGGGNRKEQIGCVERGVEIIICTPGRLNDLILAKVINLSSVTYLVG
ncbi:hypothetical protein DOY81_004838 [Sarcophaga bullata]|nr:hypothetical protein DOY81_004838 [Sarcophaga bullata]